MARKLFPVLALLVLMPLTGCAWGQSYSARTDLIPQPYPAPIPNPGSLCSGIGCFSGANFQFTPPDFSTPFVRISDRNTGGQAGGINATAGYATNSASSEVNSWSINDDRFTIQQAGAWQQLWSFNTATNQAIRSTSFVSPGTTGIFFSFTQPYIAYHAHACGVGVVGCPQFDIGIFSYDVTCGSGITTCNPTPVLLADVSTACSIAALQGNSAAIAQGDITVSGDDQTFLVDGALGNQGTSTDIYVIAWNRTNGCSYWNTATGHVFNNGVDQGTIAQTDRFYLHNTRLGKGGIPKITGQPGTCQATCTSGTEFLYFWTPFTTTVTVGNSTNGCGHQAIGYTHWVNACNGSVDVNGFFASLLSTPNTNVSLPSAYPSPEVGQHSHLNWANANASDTTPYFAIMEDPTLFAAANTWTNELLGIATDGSGKVFRFGHTYATPSVNPFVPGAISQDGKYLLWTTDWNMQLGKTDGVTALCPPCRTDVFLVTLQALTPAGAGVNVVGQFMVSGSQNIK